MTGADAPSSTSGAMVAAVRAGLRDAADPAVAPGQQASMKSAMPYDRVTAPRLEQALRPILAAYRPTDRAEWGAAIRELWDAAIHREERYAATALARHRTARPWQDPAALDLYRHHRLSGLSRREARRRLTGSRDGR